jgi:hypothetical protein
MNHERLPGNESYSAVAMLLYGKVGRICFGGDCPVTEYMSMDTSDSVFS